MKTNLPLLLLFVWMALSPTTGSAQITITPPPISSSSLSVRITGSTAWSSIQSDSEYLYSGPGESVSWVESVRENVTIHNAGTGVLTIWDTVGIYSLDISPGESVLFSTYEESPGTWQFYEHTHKAVSASSITDGTLSGDRIQPAGIGNAGAITTGAQSIAGPKTFTGTLTATSGTFGTVRSGTTIMTSATTGNLQAASSIVGTGTYGSMRITGNTFSGTNSSAIGSKFFVAADQPAPPNGYIIGGEFSASFSGSAPRIYGLQTYANLTGTNATQEAWGLSAIVNTQNSANVSNAMGSDSAVRLINGGTIAQAIGSRSYVGAYSAASTGGISTAIGFRADIQKQTSPTTISAGYGIYIGDIEANADYGIYSAGSDDDNVFSGHMAVYGNTSLGDSSNDILTISSGTVSGSNLTDFGPNAILNRSLTDALAHKSAAMLRELSMANAVSAGTGVIGTGNFGTDGRSGGYFTGDSTSCVYIPGANSLTGIVSMGQSVAWSYRWILYLQFEGAVGTNALFRIAVGLRTETAPDITSVSGNYAGVEWTSSTSARGFTANSSTASLSGAVTSSNIENTRNHVWIECVGSGGSIKIYHATGYSPKMPILPLLTLSGAPTSNGGGGFMLLARGTGPGANASLTAFNARLIIP